MRTGRLVVALAALAVVAGLSVAFALRSSRTPPPADMVLVPEGPFTMGSDAGQGEPDELPRHRPFVSAFLIDRHEASNARFVAALNWALEHKLVEVVAEAGHYDLVRSATGGREDLFILDVSAPSPSSSAGSSATAGGSRIGTGCADLPAENVTWCWSGGLLQLAERHGGAASLLRHRHLAVRLRRRRLPPSHRGRVGEGRPGRLRRPHLPLGRGGRLRAGQRGKLHRLHHRRGQPGLRRWQLSLGRGADGGQRVGVVQRLLQHLDLSSLHRRVPGSTGPRAGRACG